MPHFCQGRFSFLSKFNIKYAEKIFRKILARKFIDTNTNVSVISYLIARPFFPRAREEIDHPSVHVAVA